MAQKLDLVTSTVGHSALESQSKLLNEWATTCRPLIYRLPTLLCFAPYAISPLFTFFSLRQYVHDKGSERLRRRPPRTIIWAPSFQAEHFFSSIQCPFTCRVEFENAEKLQAHKF
jgi:hypothetical protein